MFEIILGQDYEDIFFFREFEVNGISANSPDRVDLDRNSRSQSRSRSPTKPSLIYQSDSGRLIIQSPHPSSRRVDSPSTGRAVGSKVTRII